MKISSASCQVALPNHINIEPSSSLRGVKFLLQTPVPTDHVLNSHRGAEDMREEAGF